MGLLKLLHVRLCTVLPVTSAAYQACRDNTGGRALTGSAYTDGSKMTDESCVTYCDGLGYTYAGTEYSSECCKSILLSRAARIPSTMLWRCQTGGNLG